jgi:hypothetical protein
MALVGKFWMNICQTRQKGMITNLGSQNVDDNLSNQAEGDCNYSWHAKKDVKHLGLE